MSRPLLIDLFVEDHAHEALLKPLVERVCAAAGMTCEIRVRSARGGHPRVLSELAFCLRMVDRGGLGTPDILVVALDANCQRHTHARQAVQDAVAPQHRTGLVVACPDPHVERWYMLDGASFAAVVGKLPRLARKKCERDYYKRQLASAVKAAGHPRLLGGIEFATELAAAFDLRRAAKTDRSFARFLDDLEAAIKATKAPRG